MSEINVRTNTAAAAVAATKPGNNYTSLVLLRPCSTSRSSIYVSILVRAVRNVLTSNSTRSPDLDRNAEFLQTNVNICLKYERKNDVAIPFCRLLLSECPICLCCSDGVCLRRLEGFEARDNVGQFDGR